MAAGARGFGASVAGARGGRRGDRDRGARVRRDRGAAHARGLCGGGEGAAARAPLRLCHRAPGQLGVAAVADLEPHEPARVSRERAVVRALRGADGAAVGGRGGDRVGALRWVFRGELRSRGRVPRGPVPPLPRAPLVVLALTLAGFVAAGPLGLDAAWPAAAGALAMVAVVRASPRAIDLRLLGFVLGLGLIVRALADHGLGDLVADVLPSTGACSRCSAPPLWPRCSRTCSTTSPRCSCCCPPRRCRPGDRARGADRRQRRPEPDLHRFAGHAAVAAACCASATPNPATCEFHRLGALTVPPILIGATVALWARDMKVLAWITEGGWEACVDAAAAFGAADVTLLHVTALDRAAARSDSGARARSPARLRALTRRRRGAARARGSGANRETSVVAQPTSRRRTRGTPGRTRSGTPSGSSSITRRARSCSRGRTARRSRATTRSRNPSPNRSRSRLPDDPPARPSWPAPPPGRGLDHAPRPVLPAAAQALRRHVHVARRAPRVVGDRLAPRRRQAGLHRRPERAARGRGQRDPAAAARRALGAAARRPRPHERAQGAAAAVPRRADAGLRRPDPRHRRGGDRDVADPRADRGAPAHAGADARDHHARRLRHPRRAPARAALDAAGLPRRPGAADADRGRRTEAARPRVQAHPRRDRRAAQRGDRAPPRGAGPGRARGHPLAAARAPPRWTTARCSTSC